MHLIVNDLGFGDAGKGSMVDYLCFMHKSKWNIRFSGGPQCGHRVVTPNGTDHIFSQFGSGSFQNANTFYAKRAMFNPQSWYNEWVILKDKIPNIEQKFYVHEDCLVVTPIHIFKNYADETVNRHGSTATGCWATLKHSMDYPDHAIRVTDLLNCSRDEIKDKIFLIAKDFGLEYEFFTILPSINSYLDDFYHGPLIKDHIVNDEWCHEHFKNETIVFEGNQGVLIDADYGFFPNVTSSSCTQRYALEFIDEYCENKEREVYGLMRHYMCRHGAGIFPSEDKSISINEANSPSEFTGAMRYGRFDQAMFDYAYNIVKPDRLVFSCMDHEVFTQRFIPKMGRYAIPEIDYNNLMAHEDRTNALRVLKNLAQIEKTVYSGKVAPEDFYQKIALEVGNHNSIIFSYGPTCQDKVIWSI